MSSLVTVVVATYNSSPFVVESLDSILNQTWKDIELIITDDCSIDDTVDVCKKWLDKNHKRFESVNIITTPINTGVPSNVNRGLYAAKGSWISFLAGDDTLLPSCIEDNMAFIASNPDVKVLFSKIAVYKDTFRPENHIETVPGEEHNPAGIMAPGRSAESQYRMLLLCDRIHYTPSVFLNRDTLIQLNGFDERFKLIEDYPMWLKLTRNGHRLFFMNAITVNYRRHSKAINNKGLEVLVNPNYFKQEQLRQLYTYPFLPADIRLNQKFIWYASQIFRLDFFNRNSKINKFLLLMLTMYLNPFKYLISIRKNVCRSLRNNEFYK